MVMSPSLRKFALTAHVTSSVGWLGAVAGFLALAVAGLKNQDVQTVRASYLSMELMAWCVIVPLSLASPLTGLVQSLGTSWGLFRHYWVLTKLLVTIPATIVLLMHMRPINRLAVAAAETPPSYAALGGLRTQMVADAAVALVVLLAVTALSVFKPQGRTPFGRRPEEQGSASRRPHTDIGNDSSGDAVAGSGSRANASTPRWVKALGILTVILLLLFVIAHLAGGGFGGHTPR